MSLSLFKIIELIIALIPHLVKDGVSVYHEVNSSDDIEKKITETVATLVDAVVTVLEDLPKGGKSK